MPISNVILISEFGETNAMAKERPIKRSPPCPECGSSDVVPYLYGLPNPEAFNLEKQGKVILGGCCIDGNSFEWHCRRCKHDWGRFDFGL